MELTKLNLPLYDVKLRDNCGNLQVFDILRSCWVALTPEEWVRQQMCAHLIEAKGFPRGRMNHEIGITYNTLQKRCDGVVFDTQGKPFIIMEYKAPHIKLTQKVFDQIAVYNLRLNVPYLLVSNGLQHLFCKVDMEGHKYIFAPEIPCYQDLSTIAH